VAHAENPAAATPGRELFDQEVALGSLPGYVLRAASWDDEPGLLKAASPAVARYQPRMRPDAIHDNVVWAATEMDEGTGLHYRVFEEDAPTDEILGSVSVYRKSLAGFNLGYWTAEPAWGRGIAYAASLDSLRIARDTLGIKRVNVIIASSNDASRGIAEKIGAVLPLHSSFREADGPGGLLISKQAWLIPPEKIEQL
jgi:RimJ/RimL family protein N-acetyltransferase